MATVSLTGASKEDVATVFDVLRTAFPTDRPSDAVPQEQPGDHPAVWTAQFEPTQERHGADRVHDDDWQAGPRELVAHVVGAERAGFDFSVTSDHYFPWLDSQGHAPYAWRVLSAAAQAATPSGT